MSRFIRYIRHSGHVVIPAALTGYLWLKGFQTNLPGWPCPFRTLTGIPCPGCYLTRAISAALTGQIDRSIELHLFGPIIAIGLIWWSINSMQTKRLIPKQITIREIALTASALFSYWLARMVATYFLEMNGFPSFPKA
jgi:uncharacterized membrane protein YwzB